MGAKRAFVRAMAGALVLAAFVMIGLPVPTDSINPRPNLVFFLGEGLRYDELSSAGNNILHTPNMDRIAREGFAFRNAFVINSLCLPSRATILTGLYSHSTGAVSNAEDVGSRSGE